MHQLLKRRLKEGLKLPTLNVILKLLESLRESSHQNQQLGKAQRQITHAFAYQLCSRGSNPDLLCEIDNSLSYNALFYFTHRC